MSLSPHVRALATLATLLLFGCAQPAPKRGDAGATASAGDASAYASTAARAESKPAPAPTSSATTASGAATPLVDESRPPVGGDELNSRGRHLLDAIAHDNVELAADILYPREGFLANRDAQDPVRAWEKQLSAPLRKQVHAQHKKHKGLDRAAFVSLELGHAATQVKPKRREWKQPVWRVRHAKLTYTLDGKTRRIDIGEMVGFRGAWYVTRLRSRE